MEPHRLFAVIASLVASLAWVAKAPVLLEMMRVGEISPLAVLLLIAAVIAMVAGGLRIWFGKNGRVSFILHILLAGTASLLMHWFPGLPLILSLSVAIVLLAWSFDARTPRGA